MVIQGWCSYSATRGHQPLKLIDDGDSDSLALRQCRSCRIRAFAVGAATTTSSLAAKWRGQKMMGRKGQAWAQNWIFKIESLYRSIHDLLMIQCNVVYLSKTWPWHMCFPASQIPWLKKFSSWPRMHHSRHKYGAVGVISVTFGAWDSWRFSWVWPLSCGHFRYFRRNMLINHGILG